MDYASKITNLNAKNNIKGGCRVAKIEWFSYFSTKKKAEETKKIMEKFVPSLTYTIRKSGKEYLLLIKLETDRYPKKFESMTKMIKNIIEKNGGEFDGHGFELLEKSYC